MLINNFTSIIKTIHGMRKLIKNIFKSCCEIYKEFKIQDFQLESKAFVELVKAFVHVVTAYN